MKLPKLQRPHPRSHSKSHLKPAPKNTLVTRGMKCLGDYSPGFITGAADNDPSAITTYTQAGAQFGYGQLWTAAFTLPLVIAIQEAATRIGVVHGHGLAAVIKQHYPKTVLYWTVLLILIANTVNIGANIGAMAAAVRLLIPIHFVILTLGFTFLILILEVFTSYKAVKKVLTWLALTLLAYPLTLLIVAQPWAQVLTATFVPHLEFNFQFLLMLAGVFGATISPYMFFWEASEEVEEERCEHLTKRWGNPKVPRKFMSGMRLSTAAGMFSSQLATWAIIVVAATVLHNHGLTEIHTAADAAQAIEPLVNSFPNAGFLAKTIFATGIIGLGLLSIPVLSGSAAYALAETFGWRDGFTKKLKRAHGFYGVITLATILGLIINFIGIDPVQALIISAVVNCFVAVPLLFLIARIARSRQIMGKYRSGWLSNLLVWATFAAMTLAAGGVVVGVVRNWLVR